MISFERSIERAIEVSVEIASAIAAWFKLLTTNPAASSPTQGVTTFTRASAANYFDSAGVLRSAAVDTPRYQDGGLLIEQASMNFLSNSDDFNLAPWFSQSMTTPVASNTTIAPDGTLTADTLTFDVASSSAIIQYAPTTTSGSKTFSVWVKVASGTKTFRLFSWNSAAGMGEITHIATTTWQRVEYTRTTTAPMFFYVMNDIAGGAGTMEVWGAQLEASATATSYIKTLAAPVTRAADVCYTSPANIPTLANGATFVWKGALPTGGGFHTAFATAPNYVIIRRSFNGKVQAYVGKLLMGEVAGIDTAVHTYALRTNGSNLHELLIDGVVVVTSTATGLLQPTNPLYIGSWNGGIHHLNSSTQSFTMYDTALTDAEIQGL